MPTLLQINTTLNYGSPGRIAENIGLMVKNDGWRSVIAHGPRMKNPSQLETIQTNSWLDEKIHGGLYSMLLDRHGLGSRGATRRLIDIIKRDIKPDIIHLHNIHGYYINYEELFWFLREVEVPVVWTLHDCWTFTGHCANFDAVACDQWRMGCIKCLHRNTYPVSRLLSNSRSNYKLKEELFTSLGDRLTLVPVSNWLEMLVKQSFLQDCKTQVIHNGIDLSAFYPSQPKEKSMMVLGVASPWSRNKGLNDFYKLRSLLPPEYNITLVGLNDDQLRTLPDGITGIKRTQSMKELADLYSKASVFVNLTYQDNYPTTNLEAMACGTPVLTYSTGGSPEAVTPDTGFVVPVGDIESVVQLILSMTAEQVTEMSVNCRLRACDFFSADKCFGSYIDLYNSLI